ncbi:MAG: methylated-DNA--[protein]-cysteine S-methyltransferase [Bacillota bacterium]
MSKKTIANAAYEYNIDTPIGILTLSERDGRIVAIRRSMYDALPEKGTAPTQVLQLAQQELNEYFEGARREFTVPLESGGTPFQSAVWDALRAIPYGTIASYGEIARRIGKPLASRAVGAACGANRILIMIPCHRVLGADGSLTGFASGLDAKRRLLELEGVRE